MRLPSGQTGTVVPATDATALYHRWRPKWDNVSASVKSNVDVFAQRTVPRRQGERGCTAAAPCEMQLEHEAARWPHFGKAGPRGPEWRKLVGRPRLAGKAQNLLFSSMFLLTKNV